MSKPYFKVLRYVFNCPVPIRDGLMDTLNAVSRSKEHIGTELRTCERPVLCVPLQLLYYITACWFGLVQEDAFNCVLGL